MFPRFLDGEMRTITKEKGILESKRLDLDSCKSKVRKARSMIGQQNVSFIYIPIETFHHASSSQKQTN